MLKAFRRSFIINNLTVLPEQIDNPITVFLDLVELKKATVSSIFHRIAAYFAQSEYFTSSFTITLLALHLMVHWLYV